MQRSVVTRRIQRLLTSHIRHGHNGFGHLDPTWDSELRSSEAMMSIQASQLTRPAVHRPLTSRFEDVHDGFGAAPMEGRADRVRPV